MPIKKENKHLYPENWKAIRGDILDRAGHKCEECGVPNHAIITRPERRVVSEREAKEAGIFTPSRITVANQSILHRLHWVLVVLTISHTDHDPTNNDPGNLRALCQRCHNRHDAAHRRETRDRASAVKTSKKYAGWQMPLVLKEEVEDDG